MINKSNIYTAIFSVLFVIVLISGVTLAVYTWSTTNEEEKVLEGEATCFDIDYVKGQDIGSDENMETLTLGSVLGTVVKIRVNPECIDTNGVYTLYLTTEDETSDYLIDNELLEYELHIHYTTDSEVYDGGNYLTPAWGVIDKKGQIPIYGDYIDNLGWTIFINIMVDGEKVTNENLEQVMNSVYKGYISATVESR